MRYLLLGALLRVILLLFGLYQDAHSPVPYTDVDYSVFLDGARNVVSGCPLQAAVPSRSEPMDTLQEFLDPPLAPLNGCSKGWLSVGSRYILQHEDILSARSRGEEEEQIRKNTPEGEEPFLTTSEPNFIDTHLLPLSVALLKPFLKPLAAMGNPYARPTYRYTPLLAAMLSPGAYFGGQFEKLWGKALFVLADILAALLMWDIAAIRRRGRTSAGQKDGGQTLMSRLSDLLSNETHSVGLLWLLNPFPAQIATRGSSEAILAVLVLAFTSAAIRVVQGGSSLATVQSATTATEQPVESRTDATKPNGTAGVVVVEERVPGALPALPLAVLAAPVFLALAVHMKIYPVVYGIPVLAALLLPPAISSTSGSPQFHPTQRRWIDAVAFAGSSTYALLGLSTFVWMIWGEPYLQESFLYHITRVDHRHNFSPYFLPLYLLHTPSSSGVLPDLVGLGGSELAAKLASFAPQLLVVAWIGVQVGRHDIVTAFAAQTMAFVIWNKVSTSQVSRVAKFLCLSDKHNNCSFLTSDDLPLASVPVLHLVFGLPPHHSAKPAILFSIYRMAHPIRLGGYTSAMALASLLARIRRQGHLRRSMVRRSSVHYRPRVGARAFARRLEPWSKTNIPADRRR